MDMRGHNSAAFGQTVYELSEALDKAKVQKKARFPYFKFYPRDWLEATRAMSLEERGAYIDLICILMEMEGHLRDDDKWISHQMHVSPRKWKAMKGKLVDHEKITISGGLISNERCARELDALLDQRRNISGSALTRERTKREKTVKHLRVDDEKSEKLNEIKGDCTTAVPLRALAIDSDSDLDRKKKEKEPAADSEQGAACGKRDEVEGLNGATALIVGKLAKWINPMMPDRKTAKGWLESSVSLYGAVVVRDSFAELEAKTMHGDIVARPIPLLTKICAQKAAHSKPDARKPSDMPQVVWDKIQRDIAAKRSQC